MLLGCKLRINFSSTYTMRNDYNPLARPYFNCVRQSHLTHRMYAYINKFPRSLFVIFADFPASRSENRAPPLSPRGPPIENVCAFISPEPRTPIECKIMAVCRIFAGATVTNISDKATLALAPPPPILAPAPDCVSSHPVPAGGAVPYLSILIYRELIFSTGIIFSILRTRTLDNINSKIRRLRTRSLYDFIGSKSCSRIKPKMYSRALRIDLRLFAEYMGQFKVEHIFALRFTMTI